MNLIVINSLMHDSKELSRTYKCRKRFRLNFNCMETFSNFMTYYDRKKTNKQNNNLLKSLLLRFNRNLAKKQRSGYFERLLVNRFQNIKKKSLSLDSKSW